MKNNKPKVVELNSFSIFSTFFALWVCTFILDDSLEEIIGYALILTVGILHGSNDIMLVNHTLRYKLKISNLIIFITYVIMVATAAVLFYFIPFFALSLFILFSAYHFGEQHFISKTNKFNNYVYLYYTIYGFLILTMIFFIKSKEVIDIIFDITNFTLSDIMLEYSFYVFLVLTLILSPILSYKKLISFNYFQEIILLIIMFVIFFSSTLISGFAIYFIIWHSIPSLKDQVIALHDRYNKDTLMLYLKNSALYWFVSIISLFLLYFIINDEKLFISLFFSFLAAITFPHVIVMFNLFKKK
ncbi:Brp/Blh family beta-carotene 15,15'-dioxygenase [Flavobacteriaceae bacterium]|nr:Brp/Blh family beta-carotene 15,15'-dioxygenase [Flavobacteriaceae bacterium]MDC1492609.1 Brp/Blh family beta-carotene 15,15'-dioxygenase [Flavobacteriaceae bacterium]